MSPILWLTLTSFLLHKPEPPLERYAYHQRLMGQPFDLVVYAPSEEAANDGADAVFSRIRELNQIFSDYEPDSELNQLCRTSGQAVPVSPELFDVLQRAQEMSKTSGGAFDVTVGPLVRLWRAARKSRKMPDPEALREAREKVGYQLLQLDPEHKTVTLQKPGMQLDLGGIAVGVACDEGLKILKQRGLPRAMLNGSGDILCGEPPPGKELWTIGIVPLNDPDGKPSRYVAVKNSAVSTSGDAFQFVEIDGQRYSHIVNPFTGLGLTDRSSVTIISPTCTAADAWATTLSILPLENGLRLLPQDSAALIVQAPASNLQEVTITTSPNFAKFEVQSKLPAPAPKP